MIKQEKPKYKNIRVCYEGGNSVTGKKIYELYKYCECEQCKNRNRLKREPQNRVTITTKDISKVDEVAEFLQNWTCENGNKWLETVYLQF